MKKLFRSPLRFVLIPVVIAGFVFLASFVVMKLWNFAMVDVFALRQISLWQAMALLFLSKILFGFGGRGKGRGGAPWMRRSMAKGCKDMTDEEKDRFKESMRQRMGYWGKDAEN